MKFSTIQRFYHPDDSGAGGAGSSTSTEDGKKSGESGAEETPPEGKANEKPEEKSESKKEATTFTQVEVDRIISERLQREKEKTERDLKAKQGEFQKLYEEVNPKFEAATAELEKLKASLKTTEESTHKSIDERIKEWPTELLALDPGKDDLGKRQSWVEQASALVTKITSTKKAPNAEEGERGTKGNKASSLVSSTMARRYGPDAKTP